jgi:hypothetical protein
MHQNPYEPPQQSQPRATPRNRRESGRWLGCCVACVVTCFICVVSAIILNNQHGPDWFQSDAGAGIGFLLEFAGGASLILAGLFALNALISFMMGR